ncbi:MAG: SLBB domain-containing protein [Verrucomicrobiae bacterium]|nr:SLBB domain-containing protein [Verrucomicrobiae bacterium]
MNVFQPLVYSLCVGFGIWCSGCTTPRGDFDPLAESSLVDADFKQIKVEKGVRPEHLEPPSAQSTLGPGDLVMIQLIGQEDSIETCLVMPDGMCYYSAVGGLQATGKTPQQLEKLISAEMVRGGLIEPPIVSVTASQSKGATAAILGQVAQPGIYDVSSPTRMLNFIARAGGISNDLADLGRSMLVRENEVIYVNFESLIKQGDMSQNVYLHPGDYVFLPLAGSRLVHVLGDVRRPLSIPHTPDLSLLKAIASAGGVTPRAAPGRVAIVRGTLTEPKVAIIDLKDHMKGKTQDFLLHPDDIIWVPKSPWERIERYAEEAVRASVTSLAIREGRKLADE